MTEPTIEDELAIERLTLRLLEDAYLDLTSVLRGAQPQAANALLQIAEQRVVDALSRICHDSLEGPTSALISISVGERIRGIMDHAHGRSLSARVA